MDDRLAKHLLEKNILKSQLSLENRVSLLEKLGLVNPNNLPGSGDTITDCCVFYPVPTVFDGERTGITGTPGLLIHDIVAGLIYSLNFFSSISPTWTQWNTGLTATQYQVIDKVRVGRDGRVYVGFVNTAAGVNTFFASAPAVGGTFTVIEDYASISAKYGGSTDNIRLCAFGINSLTNECLYCLTQGGENIRTYLGTGTTFTAKATFVRNTNNSADITFGDGNWLFTGNGATILTSDAVSVDRVEAIGPYFLSRHLRLGDTGDTIHWDDASLSTGVAIATGAGNVTTVVNNIGSNLDTGRIYEDRIESDLTGQYLMARNITPAPVKSADGGATWTVISALLPSTNSWYYLYVGGSGTGSQWVAVGGVKIFYSPDFGVTWTDKLGDLTGIVAVPNLNVVKLIGGSEKGCVDYTQTEALQISVSVTNPLAIHVTGGLILTLNGWAFVATTDPDIDLTSHIPTTGVRFVGIQVDDTGVLSVVDGAAFDVSDSPDVSNLPDADADKVILFFVILYADIEELCKIDFAIPAPIPVDYAGLNVGTQIDNAPADTPLDADEFGFWDVVDEVLKKITWANIVIVFTAIFDTLYASISHTHTTTKIWAPLTNGDPVSPELVFWDGDVIMVEVDL